MPPYTICVRNIVGHIASQYAVVYLVKKIDISNWHVIFNLLYSLLLPKLIVQRYSLMLNTNVTITFVYPCVCTSICPSNFSISSPKNSFRGNVRLAWTKQSFIQLILKERSYLPSLHLSSCLQSQ